MARNRPNPSRFFGLALGRYDNFNARTDGLIAAADTTPDVSLYSLLYNSSANTITTFDNPSEGQIVSVINLVAEPLAFSGDQILVADSGKLYQNANITFICHNTAWYEISRSQPAAGGKAISYITALGDATPSVAGGVKYVIATSTGTDTITDFDDGYEGQEITLINLNSAVTIDDAAGKILVGGSGQALVLNVNEAATMINTSSHWIVVSCNKIGGLLGE